jgi:hypothetical protein
MENHRPFLRAKPISGPASPALGLRSRETTTPSLDAIAGEFLDNIVCPSSFLEDADVASDDCVLPSRTLQVIRVETSGTARAYSPDAGWHRFRSRASAILHSRPDGGATDSERIGEVAPISARRLRCRT